MKKYIMYISLVTAAVVIGGVLYFFLINPPAPESNIKVELPLDHAKKCIAKQ